MLVLIFFPLRLFQPGERERGREGETFCFNFHLTTESLFCNTPRNKFVDVAIKFPEQNTFGAAVYSLLDYGRLLFSSTSRRRGCFLMTSNHLKEHKPHTGDNY